MKLSDMINELASRQIVEDKRADAVAELIKFCWQHDGEVRITRDLHEVPAAIRIQCEAIINGKRCFVLDFIPEHEVKRSTCPNTLIQLSCELILKKFQFAIEQNKKAK